MSQIFHHGFFATLSDQIKKLSALGFHPDDCTAALSHCNGHLDDAALWLTHNADLADTAIRGKDYRGDNHSVLSFHVIEVRNCYIECTVCHQFVRFEVFMAVTMKNVIFWDVTPCGSCKNRRLGGTCGLHHQGDKNRRARNVSSNKQQKHAAKK
jgi:hypothetical protein